MLDIFALIVILVIVALAIWLIITIATFPGKQAQNNNHPQVQAINALAWLGLLTFGVFWVAAFVWAQIKYPKQTSDLEQRIAELEAALENKESNV
jgi:lysylphosphatidylglycerol synthetase-like protein (DUF2156 family)